MNKCERISHARRKARVGSSERGYPALAFSDRLKQLVLGGNRARIRWPFCLGEWFTENKGVSWACQEPRFVTFWGQPAHESVWMEQNDTSLFVGGSVKPPHHRVPVRINCQHREGEHHLPGGRVYPFVPEAGYAHGVLGRQAQAPFFGSAAFPIGLVKGVEQTQAELLLPPGCAVTGLVCNGFRSRVVGSPTDGRILGPVGYQAKTSNFNPNPAIFPKASQGTTVSGKHLLVITACRRQTDTQGLFYPSVVVGGGEVGAHRLRNVPRLTGIFSPHPCHASGQCFCGSG